MTPPKTTVGLIKIARIQPLTDEMTEEEVNEGDFKMAYDELVILLRAMAGRLENPTT